MSQESDSETREALRALASSISKCEKAGARLAEGTPQYLFVSRQLRAYRVAVELLEAEGEAAAPGAVAGRFAPGELAEARQTMTKLVETCQVLPDKFAPGTPQHTLATRRLAAFRAALLAMDDTLKGADDA